MPFLGLVGTPLSYPAFNALRAAPTVGGKLAAAAASAASSSILASGAALLGAGLAGYAVGEAILAGLEDPNLLPDMEPGIAGGQPGNQYVLTIKSDIAPFGSVTQENTITGAFGAIVFRYTSATSGVFELITSNGRVPIFSNNAEDVRQAPVVISARRLDGTPEAFRTVPKFPAKQPQQLPIIKPITIPFPGIPAPVPFTPEIYPSPDTDPDQKPGKLFVPGITVKIPETGDEYRFAPDGVTVTRTTPITPFPLDNPVRAPLTPGKAVGEAPCPCPEGEDKTEEVICRIKTLQDEILDDGYNFTTVIIPVGVGGSVTGVTTEITQANVFLTQQPLNGKKQFYDAIDSDVVYGGWFSWTKEGRAGERIVLNFENNSFYPPEGADGFKYACNKGYQASGSYVKRDKRPYIDLC